jgi:GT2 family glycosyltransferase
MDRARNHIVNLFLQSDAKWLFMVDTDMAWKYEDLLRLCQSAHAQQAPVVAAVAFALDGTQLLPTMFKDRVEDGSQPGKFWRVMSWPKVDRFEVDYTGASCMYIHRSVLEKIRNTQGPNWYSFMYDLYGSSEDFAFSRRVRDAGYKIYVNTNVVFEHAKLYLFGEEDFNRGQLREDVTIQQVPPQAKELDKQANG